MLYIEEALQQLKELEQTQDREIINIEVLVESIIKEDAEEPEHQYSEQTLEDWYDFAATVEDIVDSLANVVNISLSKNENSLSEYIDFYPIDQNGNNKEYLINLRLSDHAQTSSAKRTRKNKLKSYPNHELVSILVNDNAFKTYHDAIVYLRKYLADKIMKDN